MQRLLLINFLLLISSFSLWAQQPAYDSCQGAFVLAIQSGSCTASISGSTANATKSPQTAFIPSATDDDVWYKFTTPVSADPAARFTVMLQLSDLEFTGLPQDIHLEQREGAAFICDNYYSVNYTIFKGSATNWLMTGLKPSTTYSIRLYTEDEVSRVAFKICLYLPMPPANDQCDAPTLLIPTLNGCTPSGPYSTLTATKSPQASGDGSGSDDDVWFSFSTTDVARKYIVELSNRTFNTGFGNTVIELWNSCGAVEYLVFAPFASKADLGVLATSTTYRVRVYTYGTSSRLSSFNICIKMVSPPVNDECGNATSLVVGTGGAFGAVVSATTQYASQSAQPTSPCLTNPDDDVWFRFTAPASGVVGLKIDNIIDFSGFGISSMASMLYSGACNSLVSRQCLTTSNGSLTGLTAGQDYFLRVMTSDFGAAAGFDIALQALTPPVNDNCNDALNVPVNTDRTYTLFATGTTNLASTSATPLTPCTPAASNDVWYRFTAPEGGAVHMQLFNVTNPLGGSTAMYSILYSGNCASPVQVQCSNAASTVFSGLTGSAQYLLRVMSNSPGQFVNFSLGLRVLLPQQDNGTCTGIRTLTTDVQRGTTLGLPMSNTTVACYGSVAPNKVLYYQFVATATSHYIDFSDFIRLSPNSNGLGFRVYKTGCASDPVAQSVKCIPSVVFGNEPITGLTIGNTYFVQVMENTFNGGTMEFDIRLAPPNANIWLGAVDNKFENPANWSKNEAPDMNTEVIVPGGRPRGIVVSLNATIRRLKVDQGGNVLVNPGVTLTVRDQ